ncbi:type II toxin-antitoxin system RelE/ParE family toxin [Microbacterium sp. SSW1-47]|uniref:type II toxin-antitoxin system RelE family toxin n=1 Tax=Microbacterium sufflavum TaxID=2851649 RepID=UPI001FFCD2A7|nr:type II toxin-antitoxin system RelE/ParE family toxin [Microbacterium sufflavum]MCK2025909.1 type II toxin-antitoxin system RelE/ParE family toxin [Microbacterium sufflavum]
MTWITAFADSAWRDLDRLPQKIAQAIVEFAVLTLPENPERMSKPLVDEFEGLRSARRGDYRVLFFLGARETIVVVRARHRRDAYRPPAPHWD